MPLVAGASVIIGAPSSAGALGGLATLSSTGSVLSAIPSGSTGLGAGSLAAGDVSGTNTAVGTNTLSLLTGGVGRNVAIGWYALDHLTTGPDNVAVGAQTGRALTTQSHCTFVGASTGIAATANYLTIVGAGAGEGAITADNTTLVGALCGTSLTSGANNTLGGTSSGNALTTGTNNSTWGFGAMLASVSAQNCVAVGVNALETCNANNNVAIGFYSLDGVTSGFSDTALGAYSGHSPAQTIAGALDTWIGFFTGPSLATDPTWATALGAEAQVGANYGMALGFQATATGAGSVAIGTDHTGGVVTASLQDQIMLGTANHTVYRAATNTSSGATASTPTIANTATGVQVNATKDVMLYLTCSTLGTGFTLKIGPTSTPAYTIVNNVAVAIGECFSVRVPGGWYVSWQATTAAFANQQAVTC